MILESLQSLGAQMQVLDHVHDSVVAIDLNGVVASWNHGAERLHGYTAEEAIGQPVYFFRAPEERGERANQRLTALLQSGFEEFNTVIVTKRGERRQVHVRLSLIRDAGGQPVGVLSFAIDTSELQQARAALQAREQQLRTILDAIPLLIAHLDTDYRYLFVNKEHERFLSCGPSEIVGKTVREAFPAWFDGLKPHADAALAGTANSSEHEFELRNGEKRTVIIQRIPDLGDDGQARGYFVVARDETEARRREIERLQAERQLRKALISEVHHRVKNSLQGIVGLVRLQIGSHPQLAPVLEPVITQLLAVTVSFGLMGTRGQPGIVMCDMVREICRNVTQMTSAAVELTLSEAVAKDPVVIDASYAVNVGLVVNELVFNAVKHSAQTSEGPLVTVQLDRTVDSVTLKVTNPGNQLPRSFDFQGGAGLGTGLSLARLLLPRQGARLAYAYATNQVSAELSLDLRALSGPGTAVANAPI